MRGRGAVDLMLLSCVLIWALNIVVTRYVLTNGFRPLAYASVRYGAAALLTAAVTILMERTLRFGGRRDLALVGAATVFLYLNQLSFVYALRLTTATTVALILGTTPIFTAVAASLVGLERLSLRFWLATVLSFGGVALVAVGAGGDLGGHLGGVLLGLALAATWAGYSVAIAPLMRRHSPYRISAVVLLAMGVPLVLTSVPQLGAQAYGGMPTLVWVGLAFAIVGPLALTNVLWFTAVGRVGPSRATLFANLQPFVAAVFALLLLSEHLTALQVLGGAAIAAGIVLERWRRREAAPAPLPAPAE